MSIDTVVSDYIPPTFSSHTQRGCYTSKCCASALLPRYVGFKSRLYYRELVLVFLSQG